MMRLIAAMENRSQVRKTGLGLTRALLPTMLLAPLALIWGCAGVVSGKNSNTAPPPQTFNISGTIGPTAGGGGATVTLSGAASGTTTANSSGAYTFTGLANGTYAVTARRTGYTFSPTSQSATVNGASVNGVNFTATPQQGQTFSLSGTITPTAGGGGATVTLSGAANAVTTANSSGAYTFPGLGNGTYTVAPSQIGYSFSPATQNATVSGTNVTGVNFTATVVQAHSAALSWTASTSSVSGYNIYRSTVSGGSYTKVNSSPVSGVSYIDSTVQGGTTYFFVTTAVDGSGNESSFSNEVQAIIP